jgi:nitrous-oxide reductase
MPQQPTSLAEITGGIHNMSRRTLIQRLVVCLAAGLVSVSALSATLQEVMKQRGLTDKDILAAAKTYTPTR